MTAALTVDRGRERTDTPNGMVRMFKSGVAAMIAEAVNTMQTASLGKRL